MKIREACRAPWELVYFVITAVVVAGIVVAVIGTSGGYRFIPYVVGAAAALISGYFLESPLKSASLTSPGFKHDSYTNRWGRLITAAVVSAIFGLVIVIWGFFRSNTFPPVYWWLFVIGCMLVVTCVMSIIGWFVSWCRRCVDWSG